MLNLSSTQQLNIFRDFAEQWHSATNSDLLLLSKEGEILVTSNGSTPAVSSDLLQQISTHKTTFVTRSNQNVLAVPVRENNQTYGYLIAFDATQRDASMLEWGVDNIVARLVDAQALQSMTDELIGAWDQLELIYRVTQNLTLTSDLMAALRSILQEIRKVFHVEDGFVLLNHEDNFSSVTCVTEPNASVYSEKLLVNLTQTSHVVVCNDAEACQRVWPEAPEFVQSLLATSFTVDEPGTKAAIGLINKTDQLFTAGDSKLLAALAQQVATIIHNFLTHQKLIVEERLSRELEIAAEIQESLLPNDLPQLGGLAMAVSSNPASEVGGDFFDFVTVDDRHLIIVIGDVSGKGIPAAMLTSVTRTMLRVEAMRGEPPHKIIQQANNVLQEDLGRADAFVTVFVAILDTLEGKLKYASAGHTPTLHLHAEDGEVKQLKATSPPIGISNSQETSSYTIHLKSGDILVFYTDGITEAHSPNNDLFGLSRLIYILESRKNESPESLQQYIQSEVKNFSRYASNKDDATLLIVKILPDSETAMPQNISTIVKTVDFLYPANTDHLSDISQQITAICKELPTLPQSSRGDDFIYLIELAISEICTNIIKHAYGEEKEGDISGRVTLLNNGIQLDFYDQGSSFDPNTVPEPNPDPHHLAEGGYGLHIVRQIMDVVSYEVEPDNGNHWHLIKFLTSP